MSTHIPAPLASNYDLTDAAELQLFVMLVDFSQNGPDCLDRYSADCLRAMAKRLEEDIDPMHGRLLSAIENCTGVATNWGTDLTGYGPLTADERKINAAMVRWAGWTPDGDTGAEHGPLTALDYLISTGTVDRTLHASPLDSSRERWGNGAWDVALHIPGSWQHMTLAGVAQFAANVAQGL